MSHTAIDVLLERLEEQNKPGLRAFVERIVELDRVYTTAGGNPHETASVTGINIPWINLVSIVTEETQGLAATGIAELLSVIGPPAETTPTDPSETPPGQEKKAFKSSAPYGPPVQVSPEEMAALPGYAEFTTALEQLIATKAYEIQNPPPVEPVEPPPVEPSAVKEVPKPKRSK